ncbi:hypothetical protein V2J09_023789 [Rumex salicifolius]
MPKNSTLPDLSKLPALTGPNYRWWSEELMFFFQELGVHYVFFVVKTSASPSLTSQFDAALETPGDKGSLTTDFDKTKLLESQVESESDVTIPSGKKKPEGGFEDHNRICRGHILRHLSEKLFDIYVNYDSTKEIWDNLKRRYGAEDEGKKQFVTSRWNSFQMKDDLPILDQLHKYETIVSKIQAEGISMDELLAAYVLVDKLPPSWSDYTSKLKHDKKKLSLDALIADIMIEDANRKYLGNKQVPRSLPNNANMVESSTGGKNRSQSNKFKGKAPAGKSTVEFKKKLKCWNCNKPGHKKQDCRLPPQVKDGVKSQSNSKDDLIAVTTEVNAASDVVEWIIDCGSTRHICSQKSINVFPYFLVKDLVF